jgi:RNA polymerase sigma-70 factor, ECF subfamily
MPLDSHEVTEFLLQWSKGDHSALEKLAPLVYRELHRLAAQYLSVERSDHTLQPTALVHETYLRLIGTAQPQWDGRGHFYAFAARMMRQVLVDYARRHGAAKRSGGAKVPLDQATLVSPDRASDLLALDQALNDLSGIDPRKGRIIELRYFAGMGVDETAKAMNLSVATIRRELRMAEAWLHRALSGHLQPEES